MTSFVHASPLPVRDDLRRAIAAARHLPEAEAVQALLDRLDFGHEEADRIDVQARALVRTVREQRAAQGGLDAFLHEYELSTREGVVLMCLAEALLRIPDADTADKLIADKIGSADWKAHAGHSESLFVNASTWALMFTGGIMRLNDLKLDDAGAMLNRLVKRSGEPFIRGALQQAMRILGRQFVMGRTIREALSRAKDNEARGYRHSYDMLGEAARTAKDAERYFESYAKAIAAIGKASNGRGPVDGPGISIKLSALHPRYEFAHADRAMTELLPRLMELARLARDHDLNLTVDAEEADRLELSLDLVAAVMADRGLAGWEGFGLAVQAYQKRAEPVVEWLVAEARARRRRLMVRLVKGAYWDTEIKRAQELGHPEYPVFTRKASTDVSYLACARLLLAARPAVYPQLATHNAHSIAAALEMAGNDRSFEFQRLHGMGHVLYEAVVPAERLGVPCRIYAPVGSHEDLLAYLVRRLLENGANTSFVNRLADDRLPIAEIVADPVARTQAEPDKRHPKIPLPSDMFAGPPENAGRRAAIGLDLTDETVLAALAERMRRYWEEPWLAGPIVGGRQSIDGAVPVTDPADRRRRVGRVAEADEGDVDRAMARAVRAQPGWDATPAGERAAVLERMADLLEAEMAEAMALCVREAGKSIPDAVAEVREAVDFCRYYAARARADFAGPEVLPGPTGERNSIQLAGRGVFVCISPWNFPLAIFTGQVTAALAAGNAVVAKPAEQTPLIAAFAVRLLHRAGVPKDVLHLLPGRGEVVGAALVADPRIAGVAFTGSTETARAINRTLARRDGPIVPLIAETGGQNAMIVDSSALPEQVVRDVLISAFQSAGQRCSALRVLFVQADIAGRLLAMLQGAMAELKVGDPGLLATDVGPVIDEDARLGLARHAQRMDAEAKLLYACAAGAETGHGSFFPPRAYEIDGLSRLDREVFGPILHVIRYKASALDEVIEQVNATGYGLTLGIHTRVDTTADYIRRRVKAGNAYVNRSMIGAVVGAQPFGGEGLSGTGPKAGGPRYLHRFAVERATSVDTTAAGGNASLMTL
jgi:RHH-type transcriptional regulator, proline utilization regulon repressor / proline dehydrogenase / delta 1-pyrroline-5-carboxylate dehydrogenase